MATDRIVLPGASSEGPAIPDSFVQQLRQYDPTLLVQWNPFRRRFIIQQCTEHYAPTSEHTHVCRRIYVLTAEDDEHTMLPLGDRVMDKIRAADVSRAGYGPGDLERFVKDQQSALEKHRAEIAAQGDAAIHHATRDGKLQIRKALHLIQQHNLEPNK